MKPAQHGLQSDGVVVAELAVAVAEGEDEEQAAGGGVLVEVGGAIDGGDEGVGVRGDLRQGEGLVLLGLRRQERRLPPRPCP